MATQIRDPSRPHHRFRRAAKTLALGLDSIVPRTAGIVVLAYHRVGARTTSPVDMPVAQFRRQMAHLAARADIVDIDDALTRLAASEPAVGIALTFDDGTADFCDQVLPVLVEYQLPATLYVATGFLDGEVPLPDHGVALSWNGVREAVATGLVTVGAHTHNHVLLDRCAPDVVDYELERSTTRIADELGRLPEHFAYPKAVAGSRYADASVRDRYRSAAVAGTRANRAGSTDPWRLQRSPVQNADEWSGFVAKCAGGMRLEDDVRRILNTVRYRGRTT